VSESSSFTPLSHEARAKNKYASLFLDWGGGFLIGRFWDF
jgi:hypothetical protein